MIRSSLAYIVVSSSRQRDHEEEEEEDEELDLRLRKLSIEDEEEEEVESSINLSRQESSTSSIQLNRQESTTESESSNRSATSTSPGTDQVVHPSSFITNKKEERQVLTSGTISQGLQLNMSAREMRDRLHQQRRWKFITDTRANVKAKVQM